MAGVAGALGAELLGQGDWYEAPKWVSASSPHPRCASCAADSLESTAESSASIAAVLLCTLLP